MVYNGRQRYFNNRKVDYNDTQEIYARIVDSYESIDKFEGGIPMSNINKYSQETFEDIKHLTEDGNEIWYGRELQKVLEYTKWDNFKRVIEKAQLSCENSNINVSDHFAGVGNMVELGSGAKRQINDIMLSRYACYLIVQNADPRKEIVAYGQTYFAIKTREKELEDEYEQLTEEQKRLAIRNELKNHNKSLAEAAQLAANLFRATQTDEKLRRDDIKGKEKANLIHYEVGAKVRQTIQELGGTMPEDLPTPEKSVKKIENEQKKKTLGDGKSETGN